MAKSLIFEEVVAELCQLLIDCGLANSASQIFLLPVSNIGFGIFGNLTYQLQFVISSALVE